MRPAQSTRDALRSARDRLSKAASPTPSLDAELLLARVLGVARTDLFTKPARKVGGRALSAFDSLVDRRASSEPVAYLLGRRAFRLIELDVDRRVLIPRPETELLVECALALPQGATVIDVGTGSGAVALALKHERPDLSVSGSDASPPALEVARANAQRLGLEVTFAHADLLEGIEGRWDAILANLPYVAIADRHSLPDDVVAHEPPEALFGGRDGLEVVARLIEQAAGRTGLLALEVGEGQATRAAGLARDAGFGDVDVHRDLAGIERVVLARM